MRTFPILILIVALPNYLRIIGGVELIRVIYRNFRPEPPGKGERITETERIIIRDTDPSRAAIEIQPGAARTRPPICRATRNCPIIVIP